MPRPRKKGRTRRSWTDAHALQLFAGFDVVGCGWGSVTKFPIDSPERASWPGDEVLQDMCDAWQALCDGRLEAYQYCDYQSPACWAYRVFELNESPLEAMENRRAFTRSKAS